MWLYAPESRIKLEGAEKRKGALAHYGLTWLLPVCCIAWQISRLNIKCSKHICKNLSWIRNRIGTICTFIYIRFGCSRKRSKELLLKQGSIVWPFLLHKLQKSSFEFEENRPCPRPENDPRPRHRQQVMHQGNSTSVEADNKVLLSHSDVSSRGRVYSWSSIARMDRRGGRDFQGSTTNMFSYSDFRPAKNAKTFLCSSKFVSLDAHKDFSLGLQQEALHIWSIWSQIRFSLEW